MTKVIRIDRCKDCKPYLYFDAEGNAECSERVFKKIKDINTIPKGCPLEDDKTEQMKELLKEIEPILLNAAYRNTTEVKELYEKVKALLNNQEGE